jgi:DNA-directed RNA polymerase specialized sigma24 family protein
MIDSKQLYQETFHECVAYCKPLYDLPDETGSEILFYYYFLKFSMTDISKLLLVCKNTCYRHLNIAVSQLDSYLKESGNYKINYKYIK